MPENEFRSQIMASVDLTYSNIPRQTIVHLNFSEITTRSNSLISALNSNVTITVFQVGNGSISLSLQPIYYMDIGFSYRPELFKPPCYLEVSTTAAGFYQVSGYDDANGNFNWPVEYPLFRAKPSMVDGFFGACNPFSALLTSTLECLYNITCLDPFVNYFPRLQQVALSSSTP